MAGISSKNVNYLANAIKDAVDVLEINHIINQLKLNIYIVIKKFKFSNLFNYSSN
jgi:hypothetical protein